MLKDSWHTNKILCKNGHVDTDIYTGKKKHVVKFTLVYIIKLSSNLKCNNFKGDQN